MKVLILFVLSLLSISAYTCDIEGYFFPQHALKIPEGVKGNLDQAEFEQAIKKVVDIYQPIFKANKLVLKSFANWRSDQVNARADRRGRTRRIILYGGLGRHPMMNEDSLMLVTCHEIGHHLGGAPKASSWASGEGQADYFTSLKCLRRIFAAYPKDFDTASVPEIMVKECRKTFADEFEAKNCMRTKKASLNIMTLFSTINANDSAPAADQRDLNVVRRTFHRHPKVQCRYDTLAAGAICPVDHNIDLSSRDETVGACHQKNGDAFGLRPRCWFAPKK